MKDDKQEMTTIKMIVLGKEYIGSCPIDQKDSYLEAAAYLDSKMKDAKKQNKVYSNEKIAVITAINIAYNLLQQSQGNTNDINFNNDSIQQMSYKIAKALKED